MDYFAPGLRELARIGKRAWLRIVLVIARRSLRKAETRLGLLGWQQADFDAETQRQVDALQQVERGQADLTNRTAELGREIEAVTAERAQERDATAQTRAEIDGQQTAIGQKRAEVEALLATLTRRLGELERQSGALDSEESSLDALYRRLLVTQPQTVEVRDEILRIRERLFAIEKERTEIKRGQARAAEDLGKGREELEKLNAGIREFDLQLRSVKERFEKRDAELATRIRDLEKSRTQARAGYDQLERAKGDPYREIGRVLADSGVAPVNQPDALAAVYELRQKISEAKASIVQSCQHSAAEDRGIRRISFALWSVIAIALLLIALAML